MTWSALAGWTVLVGVLAGLAALSYLAWRRDHHDQYDDDDEGGW